MRGSWRHATRPLLPLLDFTGLRRGAHFDLQSAQLRDRLVVGPHVDRGPRDSEEIRHGGDGRGAALVGSGVAEMGESVGFVHGPNCKLTYSTPSSMLVDDVSTLSAVETQSFGERLAFYREKAGLSRQQLADKLQISRAAIALLENGDSKSMAPDNLLRAAEILAVDPMVLQFGEDGARREYGKRAAGSGIGVSEPAANRARQTRDVPIIGFAIATPDLDGFFDDQSYPVGHGEGYIAWPTRDPNAYALRVKGDSMQPRIRPGELIIVEPNVQVNPGDDVVVRTRAGRKMVKQLLMKRAGEITLGSINQEHRQTTISLEEVESIQFVAAIMPRGANVKETRDPLEGTWE